MAITPVRDMSGFMRVNDYKRGPNDPDYKGFLTVAGVEYTISGWNKSNDNGPFIKLSPREKLPKPPVPAETTLSDEQPY